MPDFIQNVKENVFKRNTQEAQAGKTVYRNRANAEAWCANAHFYVFEIMRVTNMQILIKKMVRNGSTFSSSQILRKTLCIPIKITENEDKSRIKWNLVYFFSFILFLLSFTLLLNYYLKSNQSHVRQHIYSTDDDFLRIAIILFSFERLNRNIYEPKKMGSINKIQS